MELSQLFTMQRELDSFIEKNTNTDADVFQERGLALLVELAELANETRSFKFWSSKGPSEDEVILEEFVDSIHFLLSLGIARGFDNITHWPDGEVTGSLTQLFLKTTEAISRFLTELSLESYKNVWIHYGAIATTLGFTFTQIFEAYIMKNEENYRRQQTGY